MLYTRPDNYCPPNILPKGIPPGNPAPLPGGGPDPAGPNFLASLSRIFFTLGLSSYFERFAGFWLTSWNAAITSGSWKQKKPEFQVCPSAANTRKQTNEKKTKIGLYCHYKYIMAVFNFWSKSGPCVHHVYTSYNGRFWGRLEAHVHCIAYGKPRNPNSNKRLEVTLLP